MAAPTVAKFFPRADHVGSLLRPKELVEKRLAFHTGQCSAEEVKALEDKVVPQIVKLQNDLGLTVLTDEAIDIPIKEVGWGSCGYSPSLSGPLVGWTNYVKLRGC